jgi:Fe2+ or Zn2+ uptake regulation protein
MMPSEAERLPENYRLVYDVVCEQAEGMHTTAGEIFAEAKRRRPRIGHSTVYRALDRLRDLGLVSEVRVPGAASALYEPIRSGHAHFLCERCGRVEDIEYALPMAQVHGVAESRGLDVRSMSLTLHGLCARCCGSGTGRA